MTRKLNILTLLIFAYSVVVCLTCKRDFSHQSAQTSQKHYNEVILADKMVVPLVINTPVVSASAENTTANPAKGQ